MEARKAADGRKCTLMEFVENYGTARGLTEWCDAAQRHTLSELKQWASDRSLSKTGNKNELLEWLGRFDCFVHCNQLQEQSIHELNRRYMSFQPQDVRYISDRGILIAILAQMDVGVPLNQPAYRAYRSIFNLDEWSGEDDDLSEFSESDDELGVPALLGLTEKPPAQQKKSLSGFMLFSQENRERVKAECPGLSFGEIGKELGALWRALTDAEKLKYKGNAPTSMLEAPSKAAPKKKSVNVDYSDDDAPLSAAMEALMEAPKKGALDLDDAGIRIRAMVAEDGLDDLTIRKVTRPHAVLWASTQRLRQASITVRISGLFDRCPFNGARSFLNIIDR